MNVNSIIRRNSSLVDTSGQLPPVLTSMRLEGGVYTSAGNASDDMNSILSGRISLGIIGVAIVGAVGFYYFTRSIQGGG
jgi:hypothetical protein